MNVIMLYWTRQRYVCLPYVYNKSVTNQCCVYNKLMHDVAKEIKFRSHYMMFVYHCNYINNPEYHVRQDDSMVSPAEYL